MTTLQEVRGDDVSDVKHLECLGNSMVHLPKDGSRRGNTFFYLHNDLFNLIEF